MRRRRDLDFRDLAGLKARGYIRESTERQADKWGPAEQRRGQERFADEWGLRFDGHYYTDLISGRSTLKRSDFKRMIADADASEFRVLLVWCPGEEREEPKSAMRGWRRPVERWTKRLLPVRGPTAT